MSALALVFDAAGAKREGATYQTASLHVATLETIEAFQFGLVVAIYILEEYCGYIEYSNPKVVVGAGFNVGNSLSAEFELARVISCH